MFTVSGIEGYAFVIELKGFNRGLFPDVTTGFGCVIEQNFVERRTLNLICGGYLQRNTSLKRKRLLRVPQAEMILPPYFTMKSARSIFSFTPIRSKVQTLPGRSDSPILKRGNCSRSKIATFQPCFASKVPAVLPAGPPPTITMSKNSAILYAQQLSTLGIGWSRSRIRHSCRLFPIHQFE